ncbi:MAG: motility associated factor glycosyltransferase family protein [Nitrospinaceae bacterium]
MNGNSHIQEVKSATLLRFNDLWRRNFQSNQAAIRRNPGVAALKNRFRGVPAIVVGAGPSLDKNIRHLGQAVGKAVLIASDAALKPLLAHNIPPTFVTCLDPQQDITKFFTGVPHRGMTLVAPTILHPHVLALWEGGVVFYNKFAPDIPSLVEIQNQSPRLGCLTPGGSVLSIAYDLAFQTGANPILFVGQDLSYPKKKTYSRESENAEENLEATMIRQRENIVYETDMNGQTLPTLKSMSVSKQWFHWAFTTWKREGPAEIINCSEAGILTGHCTLMPLREAIYRYCRKKVNVAWTLQKALKRKK